MKKADRVDHIEPLQVQELLKEGNIIVVDVREPSEYASGHVQGAVSVPLGELYDRLPMQVPSRDAEIIVYCHSGLRSRKGVDAMRRLGYQNVRDMGGIVDWIKQGFTIVRD